MIPQTEDHHVPRWEVVAIIRVDPYIIQSGEKPWDKACRRKKELEGWLAQNRRSMESALSILDDISVDVSLCKIEPTADTP